MPANALIDGVSEEAKEMSSLVSIATWKKPKQNARADDGKTIRTYSTATRHRLI